MLEADKYRIILIAHYKELYGANRSLLNLIDGLQALGVRDIVIIAPSPGEIVDEAGKKGIQSIIISFFNEINNPQAKQSWVKMCLKLCYNWLLVFRYGRKLKKKGKKNLIHTNASATLIGAYFSRWLKVPHVWHMREFGMEDYNFEYNFGRGYFRYWLQKANAAIAISDAIYNKRLQAENVQRKEIIYNGVFFKEKIKQARELNTRQDYKNIEKITFGIIGFICPEKNQLEAIEAFNLMSLKYKKVELLIAGQGNEEYTNLLKNKVRDYGLNDKVKFVGFIEKVDLFYDSIDFLLMCSRNEGLGRVTIEAMGRAIPVIGYNNAGTSEIITHRQNGLLYSNGFEDLF